MTPRPVLLYPDPMLKQVAAPAQADAIDGVTALLLETIGTYERCVGIAAQQIGELVRVCIVDVSGHPKATSSNGRLILANPRIVAAEGSEVGRESLVDDVFRRRNYAEGQDAQ